MQPLVLIHIPKTAGTSLREGAEEFFGAHRCCYDYGPFARQTHDLARATMLERHHPRAFRERFDAGGFAFFSGHVDADRYREAFAVSEMAALVRHPLRRILSEYRHYRRYFGDRRDLPAFYRDARFINRQSRMLDGDYWAAMGVVGVSERFRESLALINAHWNTAIEPKARNLSRRDPLEEYPLTSAQRAELEALNAADLHLYRQVCEQLDWRNRTRESGEYVQGAFARTRAGVKGWAFYPAARGAPARGPGAASHRAREPVVLDIRVDNDAPRQVAADQHDQPLAERGVPDAAVGFSLPLPDGTPADRVTVRVAATGQPLALAFSSASAANPPIE